MFLFRGKLLQARRICPENYRILQTLQFPLICMMGKKSKKKKQLWSFLFRHLIKDLRLLRTRESDTTRRVLCRVDPDANNTVRDTKKKGSCAIQPQHKGRKRTSRSEKWSDAELQRRRRGSERGRRKAGSRRASNVLCVICRVSVKSRCFV